MCWSSISRPIRRKFRNSTRNGTPIFFSYEPNIYNLLKTIHHVRQSNYFICYPGGRPLRRRALHLPRVPLPAQDENPYRPRRPFGGGRRGDCPHPEAEYLARYICLLRLPFAGNKHVKIRPSYHERIREITRVIGRGDVTITAYVDKVLKAHLDDNRETIERLFEEREAVASRQPKAEER